MAVEPRFALEEALPARLEAENLPMVVPIVSDSGIGSMSLAIGGAAVLVLGLAGLEAGNFVAAQFARAPALGWATLVVCVAGFGGIAASGWRELRGLMRLARVDRLRARLADPATRREAALAWLATLPEGEALSPAVRAVNDPDAITALLRAGVGEGLRVRAQALGRVAAAQMFAVTAAVPSPALDGLVVAWRGIRLVRQVAALHGMRPGLLGTFSLLRRTAMAAAGVAAAGWATDAALRAAISSPLLAQVAGDMAGAGVAARRMVVLARAAQAACSPLPPD